MRPVYYRRGGPGGYCPVKAYFKPFTTSRERKIIADFEAKIQNAVESRGMTRHLKPLGGYPFKQMEFQRSKAILIRIIVYRHQDLLVLLHAFEKPARYDTKKAERKVNNEYVKAEENRQDFISKPHSYEEYE